ncbi:MAG: restriction endonuclease subunit S, partial [Firmicutes bacterium]|nr:restriction endonuclease subunit S [Candidatus Scybalomonas excrementavium]
MKIGDIAKVQGGYAFKSSKFVNQGIPLIRIGNINDEKVSINNDICYSEEFWDSHPEFRVNQGSILVAMSGATVGKIGIYEARDRALLNQRVGNIIPDKNLVIKDFLYYYCTSPVFKQYIEANAFGCAQPNISAKQIEEFEINVPSLIQQKKIVDILQKLDCIINIRKEQLKYYDKLVKSQFSEMFGDLKTNSKGWQIVGFKDCADIDTNMVHD